MFKASITTDLKVIEDFALFKQNIRTDVIENGLDNSLLSSLQKLKQDLNYLINSRIKSTSPQDKTEDALGNKKVPLSQAEEEILKHLNGVDFARINKSRDFSTSVQNNVMVVNSYRVALKTPIGPFTTFAETHQQAVKFFSHALFVFKDGNTTRYIQNPGINMQECAKIVCSTDVGDTDRSRKKFDHYQNSDIMPSQDSSDIGRFATWSLKQECVKKMLSPNSGFVDLTPIVEKIKSGDFEGASIYADSLPNGKYKDQLKEKLDQIDKKQTVNSTTKAYLNIVRLVKNLTIDKQVTEDSVIYSLASNFDGTADNIKEDEIFQEIQRNINLWLLESENHWYAELTKIIEKTIQDFYKAG